MYVHLHQISGCWIWTQNHPTLNSTLATADLTEKHNTKTALTFSAHCIGPTGQRSTKKVPEEKAQMKKTLRSLLSLKLIYIYVQFFWISKKRCSTEFKATVFNNFPVLKKKVLHSIHFRAKIFSENLFHTSLHFYCWEVHLTSKLKFSTNLQKLST